ncbi:MAG: tetratricopeptide repeat protein [Phycisphaerales bacterium]|nr:tetratricopeptide repeat protein [Phycisphaerales bacterium]
MPDQDVDTRKPELQDDEAPSADEVPADSSETGERGPIWQVPLLIASILLLASGLYLAVRDAPPNDFDGALDTAARYLRAGEYDLWRGEMDGVGSELDRGATDAHRARYYLLRADGVFLRQRQVGVATPEYNQLIVEDYTRAREYGAALGGAQQANLAETLMALGREDEGLGVADALPGAQAHRRHRIYLDLIEWTLAAREPGYEKAQRLLGQLQQDRTLSAQMRAWVHARRAQVVMDQGFPDEAVTMLLRSIQRVEADGIERPGELLALLGRAYFELGEYTDAAKQLRRAEMFLKPDAPLMGKIHVYLGQIEQVNSNYNEAREAFARVLKDYPGTPSYDMALLGQAEVDASLEQWDDSLTAYRELVTRFTRAMGPPQTDVTREQIAESLLSRYQRRVVDGDYERALECAVLAEDLYRNLELPAHILLIVAQAHHDLAEALLNEATGGAATPAALLQIDLPVRRRIRAHFHEAGESHIQHARLMTLQDNLAYGESLWAAGGSYDQAGDHELAIEAFAEYLQSRDKDVREPAARFRLGRLYQAKGDYETAASYYQGLISGPHRTTLEAQASYVPLAHCLLQIDPDRNYDAAKRSLLSVLDGNRLEPSAGEFRDALVELGQMHYTAGEFPQAIERLEEALARYPDDRLASELKFKLADAYRLEAGRIDDALDEAMPQSEADLLTATRTENLKRAAVLYENTRTELSARDQGRLTDVQRNMLRDSFFHCGDCAYQLGEYEEAIERYNIAIAQYADDPASLVASVQKVNAFIALGRMKEASTAHQAARVRLQSVPDEAFENDQFLLMTREQWEAWLDSVMVIRSKESRVTQASP